MTTAHTFSDARIIGTLRGFAVEASKHEVDLVDGSILALHFVADPRDPEPRSRCLRAVILPGGDTAVFDLCRLASTLRVEMPGYTARDWPGLIKYTLRPIYRTRAALMQAIEANAIAVGSFDRARELA